MKKVAVILAGGVGARLWPRSREKRPKQFTHILGEGTMIQNTVARLQPLFQPEDIFVVTTPALSALVRDQLQMLPEENVIVEPFGRNTAPSTCLAALILRERFNDEIIMAVLPSDHIITNVGEYQQTIETSCAAAEKTDGIITLGIPPTRPETGYGYIQALDEEPGDAELFQVGLRPISTFAEKPDIGTAQRFMEAGDFLWNTGIFVWKMSTFWSAVENHLPDYAPLFALLEKHLHKDSYTDHLDKAYRQLRSTSLDYGIMEKATNVYVIEGSFGWSDVGNWDEVFRLLLKDEDDNVLQGNVIAINSHNCLVSSKDRLISIVGIDDLVVIDSDSALVVCRRGSSQDVKEIIDFMRRKHITHYL